MSFVPLRFLHACNLFLDEPLQNVGAVSEKLLPTIEDATLLAFRRVIELAQRENVDFLLLTGNSFVEAEQSLRARVSLVTAFEELESRQISVYVLPGQYDPYSAWESIPGLPANVTILSPQDRTGVQMVKGEQLIASLHPLDQYTPPISSDNTFQIGLQLVEGGSQAQLGQHLKQPGVDYLALGGSRSRISFSTKQGIVHHPGSPQGLSPNETGSHGCTLVTVDESGDVDCRFQATGIVRRENLTLTLDSETTQDALLKRMQNACQEAGGESCEKVWLIHWKLEGSGRLFEMLHTPNQQQELGKLFEQRMSPNGIGLEQQFTLLPGGDLLADATGQNRMAQEFFETLTDWQPFSRELLRDSVDPAQLPSGCHLNDLLDRVDPAHIQQQATLYGMHWFCAHEETTTG